VNKIVQVKVCRYRLTEVIFSRLVEEGIVKDRVYRNPTEASLRRIQDFRPERGKYWAGFYLEV